MQANVLFFRFLKRPQLDRILRDDRLIETEAEFGLALKVCEVDINNTETFGEARGPLEVIE
jgi:hypothetical protein